jgi:uncharacterized protein with HEPN domain
MYKRGDKEFILDMLNACEKIIKYTENLDFEAFLEDEKTIDACIRNLEILGEAVKNISLEFTKKYPEIEWREIARTRDKLIHSYFGVDTEILWKIVKYDIQN